VLRPAARKALTSSSRQRGASDSIVTFVASAAQDPRPLKLPLQVLDLLGKTRGHAVGEHSKNALARLHPLPMRTLQTTRTLAQVVVETLDAAHVGPVQVLQGKIARRLQSISGSLCSLLRPGSAKIRKATPPLFDNLNRE